MDKQRHQAYLALVNALLNCAEGEEKAILQEQSDFVDAGLSQTMGEIAELLTWNGDKVAAGRLQTLASQLADPLSQEGRDWDSREQTKTSADRLFERGTKQYQVNQFKSALKSWQQALAFYQKIGDAPAEAKVLEHLGMALKSLGDYQQAIERYQQSLTIQREGSNFSLPSSGNFPADSDNRKIKGEFRQAMELAIAHFAKHLQLMKSIGDRLGEAHALANLGKAYYSLRAYPQAIEYHQASLDIQQEIGDRAGETVTWGNLGKTFESLGEFARAIACHQKLLAILQTDPNSAKCSADLDRQRVAVFNDLGNACCCLGNYQQAIGYYQQALTAAQDARGKIEDKIAKIQLSVTFSGLGNAYSTLGKLPKAIEYYQQSLELKQEIGDRFAEAIVLGNLSQVYSTLGEYPQALTYHQQAIAIKQEIGD